MITRNNKLSSLLRKLTAKAAASRFFTVSLVIHIVLISALGSIVIFKNALEKETFVALGGKEGSILQESGEETAANAEEEVLEFEEPAVAGETSASAVSPASAISSLTNTTTSWSTNASMEQTSFGNSLTATRTLSTAALGGKAGTSQGHGGSAAGAKMSGTLFGVKVEAAKLGVILDVSGSAQKYLIYALQEIDKSFKGATIILYVGCGMSEASKPGDYVVKPARPAASKFGREDNHPQTVFAQVDKWVKANRENENYIKSMLRSENVYIVVNDGKNPTLGCQFAFEHLVKSGVDTIYWFADFADKVDAPTAQKLSKTLQSRNIKVIGHNFAGHRINETAMILINETGGQAIRTVPGK